MARHPCEFYIKYLLTRPQGDDDRIVIHGVTSLGFPGVTPEIVAYLRQSLLPKIPAGFNPGDRYHRQTAKFLRSEGIWSLYHPDEGARQAINLLMDLKARDIIEKLLMGSIEHKDIAKKVNARLSVFYTATAIQTYEHYFWNVPLLRVQDWMQVFDQNDPRRDKVLAINHVGSALALHTTGFQQQIESRTILREMMSGLYFDFKEWQAQPRSLDRTDAMVKTARGVSALENQLSQSDAALKDTLKSFEQLRMRHALETVPDVRELAPHGNFSSSGAKLLEAVPVVKEEMKAAKGEDDDEPEQATG